MSEKGDDFDFSGLEDLAKFLKENQKSIKVGIIGNSSAREGGLTNAEIGLYHEFGTEKLRMRSFLRYPLANELPKKIEILGVFESDEFEQALKGEGTSKFIKKLAGLAESTVLEAFDTGGFGMWEESNMENKENHQTLVESKQLRDSITSEIK